MNQNKNCNPVDETCSGFSEVFELIHDIDKKFENLQRRNIKNENLTTSQYFVLRQLWEAEVDLKFKDLAKACNCSRSTITGVIDTMEKKGLVKRMPHPTDRRSLLVKLTNKGKALKESTPTLESLTDNCCQGINMEELKTLITLLKRVSRSLI
ncbi:MAG: MarR family winged helix-turn-helix transcriptional regulator [Promethearchaeota archaeon]|jgi:DNA-binding MarR family transcriptional regulator